jgi:hypothetical protein
MDYEGQLIESENGFSARLCMAQVEQRSLEPHCSLLATSQHSGMLLVGVSAPEGNTALIFPSASDVISACKTSSSLLELRSLPHTDIPLPAPPLSLLWSPDETLAAIATVAGHVFVHSSMALSKGDVTPLSYVQAPSIRQIAIAGQGPHLLIVTQTFDLLAARIGTPPLSLSKSRENVKCIACSSSLTAIGMSSGVAASITFSKMLRTGVWTDLCTEEIPYGAQDSLPHLDALGFVAPDALAVHMLAVDSSGDAANEEDDIAVLELDSDSEPTHVKRGLVGTLRYHALDTQVRRNNSTDALIAARGAEAGPYMHVAAFPSDIFPAAIVASAIRNAEHFVHLFRNNDREWEEIVCGTDGLQAKLPNTPGEANDSLFVANFVIGVALVTTRFGEDVMHPTNESGPPAQVCIVMGALLTMVIIAFLLSFPSLSLLFAAGHWTACWVVAIERVRLNCEVGLESSSTPYILLYMFRM